MPSNPGKPWSAASSAETFCRAMASRVPEGSQRTRGLTSSLTTERDKSTEFRAEFHPAELRLLTASPLTCDYSATTDSNRIGVPHTLLSTDSSAPAWARPKRQFRALHNRSVAEGGGKAMR